jgi:hypothetical protein
MSIGDERGKPVWRDVIRDAFQGKCITRTKHEAVHILAIGLHLDFLSQVIPSHPGLIFSVS